MNNFTYCVKNMTQSKVIFTQCKKYFTNNFKIIFEMSGKEGIISLILSL